MTCNLTRNTIWIHKSKSAEEALEVTERTSFKLFILDLNLPGMNGVELCKEIRSHSPMAICIAVTGYTSLFELHDCREAGFEDYFTKQVSLVELNEVVEHLSEAGEMEKEVMMLKKFDQGGNNSGLGNEHPGHPFDDFTLGVGNSFFQAQDIFFRGLFQPQDILFRGLFQPQDIFFHGLFQPQNFFLGGIFQLQDFFLGRIFQPQDILFGGYVAFNNFF
ncbi:MAG: response regulator [Desulfohalobiaceae bacterium]|nr:response regulator [Desulfohalobiaceae bacterium]